MNLLVTGGCGFIGSHFVRMYLKNHPEDRVYNLDSLTYAAHPDTPKELAQIAPDRYSLIEESIVSSEVGHYLNAHSISAIVNFAAETHVDRSILDPGSFVTTNVLGIQNLLSLARETGNIRFVHVSTDEVYGALRPQDAPFTESSPLHPNSPYAASKASSDLLALASYRTYGQDILITRCTNNFGPYQFPEKLLPLLISNALENQPIPVYGDGQQVRDWIYVEDHCLGIEAVLKHGKSGEVYNLSSSEEWCNLDLVKKVLSLMGRPESLIRFVGDRPGHDRRYGLDASKSMRELGWKPRFEFDGALHETIQWYTTHRDWSRKVKDSKYQQYYNKNYDGKFANTKESSL